VKLLGGITLMSETNVFPATEGTLPIFVLLCGLTRPPFFSAIHPPQTSAFIQLVLYTGSADYNVEKVEDCGEIALDFLVAAIFNPISRRRSAVILARPFADLALRCAAVIRASLSRAC